MAVGLNGKALDSDPGLDSDPRAAQAYVLLGPRGGPVIQTLGSCGAHHDVFKRDAFLLPQCHPYFLVGPQL